MILSVLRLHFLCLYILVQKEVIIENKVLKNVLFLIRDLINQFNIASLIIKQNFISIETKTGKSVFMLHHDNGDRLV